jgi:hypothetical protein
VINIAPIVLFVYNRPWHTQRMIEALQENELANKSELFIYADNAKRGDNSQQVQGVRDYIKTIDGFKRIKIIERSKNWGLSASIIDGVTSVLNEYGKVIVLEDDHITSPYFLKFMNDALEFYKDEPKVWHVSGWNYPIDMDSFDEVFLWRLMNCWGWATWADKWQYFEKDTKKLMREFSRGDIKKFNLDGAENVWFQVVLNKYKYTDTWAVYWYATIFKNQGLCLNPVKSFVRNIGHDGSGNNCNDLSYKDNQALNVNDSVIFVANIRENKAVLKQIKSYLRMVNKNIFTKVINKLTRMIVNKNLIK